MISAEEIHSAQERSAIANWITGDLPTSVILECTQQCVRHAPNQEVIGWAKKAASMCMEADAREALRDLEGWVWFKGCAARAAAAAARAALARVGPATARQLQRQLMELT